MPDKQVVSVDPSYPDVTYTLEDGSDVITGECGLYKFRIEREHIQTSRITIMKCRIPVPGVSATVTVNELFCDVSVHHQLTEHDGYEFTKEVLHVACALIWSAIRQDNYTAFLQAKYSHDGFCDENQVQQQFTWHDSDDSCGDGEDVDS